MTEFVEDEKEIVEIDDVSYVGFDVVSTHTDHFKKLDVSSLPTKMKRKANSLIKKAIDTEGATSKYIDPETIDGYALFDVVTPPYDLDTLAELYEQSSIHYAAVNARTMNTVSTCLRANIDYRVSRARSCRIKNIISIRKTHCHRID